MPQAALDDLRQRVLRTRWPDKETVTDESQGIRSAEMQALLHYWANGYNWRNGEAKLNALPGLFSEEIRAAFRSVPAKRREKKTMIESKRNEF